MYHLLKYSCRPCTVHPFIETILPDDSVLYQQDNAPWGSGIVLGTGADLVSKFPKSQSNRASAGCAEQSSPTSHLTGLKEAELIGPGVAYILPAAM